MRTRSTVQQTHVAGGDARHPNRSRRWLTAFLSALAIMVLAGTSATSANAATVSAAQGIAVASNGTIQPRITINITWGAFQDPFKCASTGAGLKGTVTQWGKVVDYRCAYNGLPGPAGPWVLILIIDSESCGAQPLGTRVASDANVSPSTVACS